VEDLKTELQFYLIPIPEFLYFFIISSCFYYSSSLTRSLRFTSTLLKKYHETKIREWTKAKNLTLIYTGSRDGFGAKSFHEFCDHKVKEKKNKEKRNN